MQKRRREQSQALLGMNYRHQTNFTQVSQIQPLQVSTEKPLQVKSTRAFPLSTQQNSRSAMHNHETKMNLPLQAYIPSPTDSQLHERPRLIGYLHCHKRQSLPSLHCLLRRPPLLDAIHRKLRKIRSKRRRNT